MMGYFGLESNLSTCSQSWLSILDLLVWMIISETIEAHFVLQIAMQAASLHGSISSDLGWHSSIVQCVLLF